MAQSPTMYLVRLHIQRLGQVEYGFLDVGRATEVKNLVAAAMLFGREPPKEPRTARNPHSMPWADPGICHFDDDAGREAHWVGGEVIGVQLIDLAGEVEMNARALILAKRAEQALLLRAGEVPSEESAGDRSAFDSNGYAGSHNNPDPGHFPDDRRAAAPPPGAIGRFAS